MSLRSRLASIERRLPRPEPAGPPMMTVVERAVACWRLYARLYGEPWTKMPPQLVTEDGRPASGPAAEAFARELLAGWREARDRGVPPEAPPAAGPVLGRGGGGRAPGDGPCAWPW
jgi:hypothetical protein